MLVKFYVKNLPSYTRQRQKKKHNQKSYREDEHSNLRAVEGMNILEQP